MNQQETFYFSSKEAAIEAFEAARARMATSPTPAEEKQRLAKADYWSMIDDIIEALNILDPSKCFQPVHDGSFVIRVEIDRSFRVRPAGTLQRRSYEVLPVFVIDEFRFEAKDERDE